MQASQPLTLVSLERKTKPPLCAGTGVCKVAGHWSRPRHWPSRRRRKPIRRTEPLL